jgi:hypothetical protein
LSDNVRTDRQRMYRQTPKYKSHTFEGDLYVPLSRVVELYSTELSTPHSSLGVRK